MTETSRLQTEIPEPLHRMVRAAAAATGRTLAEVTTEALDRWLWVNNPALAGALQMDPGEALD